MYSKTKMMCNLYFSKTYVRNIALNFPSLTIIVVKFDDFLSDCIKPVTVILTEGLHCNTAGLGTFVSCNKIRQY